MFKALTLNRLKSFIVYTFLCMCELNKLYFIGNHLLNFKLGSVNPNADNNALFVRCTVFIKNEWLVFSSQPHFCSYFLMFQVIVVRY